jgi:hypothetical protein
VGAVGMVVPAPGVDLSEGATGERPSQAAIRTVTLRAASRRDIRVFAIRNPPWALVSCWIATRANGYYGTRVNPSARLKRCGMGKAAPRSWVCRWNVEVETTSTLGVSLPTATASPGQFRTGPSRRRRHGAGRGFRSPARIPGGHTAPFSRRLPSSWMAPAPVWRAT